MSKDKRIYWDSDVFLSYINNHPARVSTIEAILDSVLNNPNSIIVTSTISRVEVCWAAVEKLNRTLLQDEVERIDALLGNQSVVELVDFNDEIALIAREYMRKGMENGGKRLRTNDAIHLASSIWVQSIEFNTYNLSDYRYFEPFVNFPIREPITDQPKFAF